MPFLIILVIALGWAGYFWSWGRDRYASHTGFGFAPNPFAPRPATALAPPRTQRMARRRRREVLGALALLALLTFLLARAWSPLWSIHFVVDVALAAYGWAVFAIERPKSIGAANSRPTPRAHPVIHATGDRERPGPRVEHSA